MIEQFLGGPMEKQQKMSMIIIQLHVFQTFLGNSQNYLPLGAQDPLMKYHPVLNVGTLIKTYKAYKLILYTL